MPIYMRFNTRMSLQRIVSSVVLGVFLLVLFTTLRPFPALSSKAPESSWPLDNKPTTTTTSTTSSTSPSSSSSAASTATSSETDPWCATFPSRPDIQLVLKTGANEIYDKLPTQLLTTLRCYPDFLIFSDLEQDIGPYHVYDALANVSAAAKDDNPDFEYYRTLQQYWKYGEDIGALKKEMGKQAWNLDKYKFLHMLEKTWALRPGKKWYVFIEADTYLVSSNLFLWLDRKDASKPWYIGSPTYIANDAFAHGGSGFVISGVAMGMFAEGDPGVANRYDMKMKSEQFGDWALRKALKDKGVEFTKAWPMFQAEKPIAVPFGPGPDNGVRHWCQPILTFHHVTPQEVSTFWRWERRRADPKKPLLLEEVYKSYMSPNFEESRDDWYNLSDDIMFKAPGEQNDRGKESDQMTVLEKKAHLSFEDCGRACEEHPRCFQYNYHKTTCGFSYSFRLGSRKAAEDGSKYRSGWNLGKIRKFQASNVCSSPEWL